MSRASNVEHVGLREFKYGDDGGYQPEVCVYCRQTFTTLTCDCDEVLEGGATVEEDSPDGACLCHDEYRCPDDGVYDEPY